MIISSEFYGVKAISTGFFQAGPFSVASLASFLSPRKWEGEVPAPVPPVAPPSNYYVVPRSGARRTPVLGVAKKATTRSPGKGLWGGELPVSHQVHVGRDAQAEGLKVLPPSTPAEKEAAELPTLGTPGEKELAWLASKGYRPVEEGHGKVHGAKRTVVVGDRHPRLFAAIVETGHLPICFSESKPSHPATPLMEAGALTCESSDIPGQWKRLAEGVWKFEEVCYTGEYRTTQEVGVGWDAGKKKVVTKEVEVSLPVHNLGATRMPFGTMRIFPRPPLVEGALVARVLDAYGTKVGAPAKATCRSEADELGFEGKTLGQMLESQWDSRARGVAPSWQAAQRDLLKQWATDGEDAGGVLVPVKGLPIAALKDSFLEAELPLCYGELRQRIRQYLDARKPAEGVDDWMLEPLPSVEVMDFTSTPSGYWNDSDEYVNTGCSEGHMLTLGWRREFTQVLRCEDAYGRRLSPAKARALAAAAERKSRKDMERESLALPAGHEEYDDGRPVEGHDYREASQIDRFAAGKYQEEVVAEACNEFEDFSIEDDYDPLELRDNCIANQDEDADLLRPEVKFTGHLAANDPRQMWYGALRTLDRLERIRKMARTPGEDGEDGTPYAKLVRAELDATCRAVRESKRFLDAAERTETPHGSLKSQLQEAAKAAAVAVKQLEGGLERVAQRVAFALQGLVACPAMARWAVIANPKAVLALKTDAPDIWKSLPAKVKKQAKRKTPHKSSEVAWAYRQAAAFASKRRRKAGAEKSTRLESYAEYEAQQRRDADIERIVRDTILNEVHKYRNRMAKASAN